MFRNLVRDPWAYVWSALGIGSIVFGALLLTGCSGMEVSYKSGSIDPGAITKGLSAAGQVAGALGFPWLEAGLTAVGTILGGVGVTSRVIKAKIDAHDAKPYTAEDVASIEAAKAGNSKPVA